MGILQLLLSDPVRALQMHLISNNTVTSCANICVIENNDKPQDKKNQKERKKSSIDISADLEKRKVKKRENMTSLWGFKASECFFSLIKSQYLLDLSKTEERTTLLRETASFTSHYHHFRGRMNYIVQLVLEPPCPSRDWKITVSHCKMHKG